MAFKENGGETKFSEIAAEFGGQKPHIASEYYKGGRWVQERSDLLKITPQGLAPGNLSQLPSEALTYPANAFYLIKCNGTPNLHDTIFGSASVPGSPAYTIITSVTTFEARYPEVWAGLSDSDREWFEDVYEIRGNGQHTYPVTSNDSLLNAREGARGVSPSARSRQFNRGKASVYRKDPDQYGNVAVGIFNPSAIPFKQERFATDPLYGDGTPLSVSNFHDSYSSTPLTSKSTSKSTNRTTAGAENTTFQTSRTTAGHHNTSFNTTFLTTNSYSQNTTYLTTVSGWFGHYYQRNTSRTTSWTQNENTSRSTSRSTSGSTFFNTTVSTSGLTVFNTTYNTTRAFWD